MQHLTPGDVMVYEHAVFLIIQFVEIPFPNWEVQPPGEYYDTLVQGIGIDGIYEIRMFHLYNTIRDCPASLRDFVSLLKYEQG